MYTQNMNIYRTVAMLIYRFSVLFHSTEDGLLKVVALSETGYSEVFQTDISNSCIRLFY
jgi:hypothetical protein